MPPERESTPADWPDPFQGSRKPPPVGPVVSVTIVFRTAAAARFARFSGSAWRGAFGHSLKRLVCVMQLRPCEGCPLQGSCIFPQIFEPTVPAGAPILANYRVAPTGFVLDPAETPRSGFFAPEDDIAVTLRLFGRLTRFGPYVLRALVDAAERGIGPDRATLSPDRLGLGLDPDVRSFVCFTEEAASIALTPAALFVPPYPARPQSIVITTPLRLRLRNDLVTPQGLRPAHLLRAALRRVSLVSLFFGAEAADGPPTGGSTSPDWRALAASAERLAWSDSALHWVETTRRSGRQQATLRMGGILGRAVLDLTPAPELWPYLWLGQWLHVGKSPTMGFGRYRVVPC